MAESFRIVCEQSSPVDKASNTGKSKKLFFISDAAKILLGYLTVLHLNSLYCHFWVMKLQGYFHLEMNFAHVNVLYLCT